MHSERAPRLRADGEDPMFEGVAAADRENVRRRAARLSALLAAEPPDAATVAASAAAMRAGVLAGAADAHRGALSHTHRAAPRTAVLRAATVLLVLAAALALVPPVRAWVGERVHDAAQALGLASGVVPAAVGTADADDAVRIRFAAPAGTLDLELDLTPGTLVTLRLRRGAGPQAEATGSAHIGFLVTPAGLHVSGARHGDELELALPPAVRQIRVPGAAGPGLYDVPPDGTVRIAIQR